MTTRHTDSLSPRGRGALRLVLACSVALVGCSDSPTGRDSAPLDRAPGADAQRPRDSAGDQPHDALEARAVDRLPLEAARKDVAGSTDSAVPVDGAVVPIDGAAAEGGAQPSARIDFVVNGPGANIAIKAHNCSGLYGTWAGTMVVSGGASGQGTFTLPIDQTGTGSFNWSFPVTTAGGTVTYTGVGQATLQAGGTAMKADVTVTVITSVGSSTGNFTDTPPILRGGYALCGGN